MVVVVVVVEGVEGLGSTEKSAAVVGNFGSTVLVGRDAGWQHWRVL
jgi:hypothetical protein